MGPPPELVEATEGATTFLVPASDHERGPKARQGVPFHNPAMRLARDVSVLLAADEAPRRPEPLEVCDATASLGARGLRLAHEVPRVHVLLNDVNLDAVALAKRNADRLGLANVDVRMGRLEPLLADHRFDWVDLDPYGTPAAWLDLAAASVRHEGILAVTATDKATLSGVYPDVCRRRYNARPLHGPVMGEVAARILVGAIARAAGRRDRSIVPLLTHSTQHYVRSYVRVVDGADQANAQARTYAYAWVDHDLARRFEDRPPAAPHAWAGPLWAGPLGDAALLARLAEAARPGPRDTARLLARLTEEAQAPPLYYTVDEFTRSLRQSAPRIVRLLARLHDAGHRATRTHFTPRGFKTDAPPDAVRHALAEAAAPTPR